ncbi:hypothetical protein Tco_0551508 [Tanacetum coccineum]
MQVKRMMGIEVGWVIMHCFICIEKGHNIRSFTTKVGISQTSMGGKTTRGGSSARGGKTIRGGNASGSAGGSQSVRGGKVSGSADGSQFIRGGKTVRVDGEGPASGGGRGRGWSTPAQVFKIVNGKAVRQRGRGDGSKSSAYPHGIRPIGYGVSWDLVDGERMAGNMQGILVPAWPYDGTLDDLFGADEIPVTNTQPMAS